MSKLRAPSWFLGFRIIMLAGAAGSLGAGLLLRPSGNLSTAFTPTATLPHIEIYFSHPDKFDGNYAGGPDEALVHAIDSATAQIDIAAYDLDLLSVARALGRAFARGVRIRIVTDSDNWHNEGIDLIRGIGIPIVGDGGEALMHDKFMVLDANEVWTGSMNYTVNDAYRNDNNLVRIQSPELAAVFTGEFEEMFLAKKFGSASPDGPLAPLIIADGIPIQVAFAPEDKPSKAILASLRSAQKNIHVMAFSFTAQSIAEAIAERARSGVTAEVLLEKTQAKSAGEAIGAYFLRNGISPRLDGNSRNMHHKVILIDGEWVLFGSYNFSASAEEKNDETLLVLHSSLLTGLFESEFQRVYALGSVITMAQP